MTKKTYTKSALRKKTKAQLIDLILGVMKAYPGIRLETVDQMNPVPDNRNPIIARIRNNIDDIGEKGDLTAFSSLQKKLADLLKNGQERDVILMGETLRDVGILLAGESDDPRRVAMAISPCISIVVKALEQSGLTPEERLLWALGLVQRDEYHIFGPVAGYVMQFDDKKAWNHLANRLLDRLETMGSPLSSTVEDAEWRYPGRLKALAIHALERAGRSDEILSIYEKKVSNSKHRASLSKRVMNRFPKAEKWISRGIQATGTQWIETTTVLCHRVREIYMREKILKLVATLRVDEFIRYPLVDIYRECEKASRKAGVWPAVRERLQMYLETGALPWNQEQWPLPVTGFIEPEVENRKEFPLTRRLIDIAIGEKKPDRVLHWYDQLSGQNSNGLNKDLIAAQIRSYAPDRAVAIWQTMAEDLIAEVKPASYEAAVACLNKAESVMTKENRKAEWEAYMNGLKTTHFRKTRLMEMLNG